MNLVSVMRRLHASGIEVRIASQSTVGWELEIEGTNVAREIVGTLDGAADWFHSQALLHFPESTYSKSFHRDEVEWGEGAACDEL